MCSQHPPKIDLGQGHIHTDQETHSCHPSNDVSADFFGGGVRESACRTPGDKEDKALVL